MRERGDASTGEIIRWIYTRSRGWAVVCGVAAALLALLLVVLSAAVAVAVAVYYLAEDGDTRGVVLAAVLGAVGALTVESLRRAAPWRKVAMWRMCWYLHRRGDRGVELSRASYA